MGMLRAHFADELTPGFRKIFFDKFQDEEMQMDKLFKVNTSEKDSEKDSSVSGFGLAAQTGEGAPIHYEDALQGYDKTYVHVKYSNGYKVTLEMKEDGLYGTMNKLPAALGRCMRRTSEDQAAKVFNNGFSSTYADGADGKVLFSVSHPRPDGGTAQSNASATGIVFSEPNLETARIAFRKQLDDKGNKIGTMPKVLLVPVELEKQAHLIVDSTQRSGTADNDANFNKGRFQIIAWEYLTSTTAWFLLDKNNAELNWFWRRKPTFKTDELFDTEYAVYKSTMRLSRSWSDWRATWGSAGDAAAYAN